VVRDEEASDGESDEAEPPKKKRKGREKKKKGKVRAGLRASRDVTVQVSNVATCVWRV
jgi:hypothetical protein